MACDKLKKPEIIDEKQIAECMQCEFLSVAKHGCFKFSFYFDATKNIKPEELKNIRRFAEQIVSGKHHQNVNLTKPTQTPCDDKAIEKDYEQYSGRYAGLPESEKSKPIYAIVSKETYLARRITCRDCVDKKSCTMRGCMRREKLLQIAAKCPQGKW